MSRDTQPTLPFPAEWAETEQERPRRRRWPWLIALVVVLALLVAAFFAGEWIARDLVTKTVRQQIVARLDLPADQQVDIDIPGSLLVQLVSGTIDEATLSAPDVAFGDVSGDVTVRLTDLAPFAGPTMGDGTATVVLDQQQLRALLATVDGFPADTVALAEPNVTAATTLSFFGADIPLALALTPSAADGDLVLAPVSLQLGGADITADGLRQQFGGIADSVLQGWHVCIADKLPAGVPLTGVAVVGDQLVADFGVQGALLTDAALRDKGAC
ncbi:DUF2993 domain-containing protein [Microbacterium sp. NPDC089189]|uniref:LmeA family phospholipid-binding protein n=1 Tax=Microbacterium sp. NPDC089189 TaxID=3154972 RepID=UPI0034261A0B